MKSRAPGKQDVDLDLGNLQRRLAEDRASGTIHGAEAITIQGVEEGSCPYAMCSPARTSCARGWKGTKVSKHQSAQISSAMTLHSSCCMRSFRILVPNYWTFSIIPAVGLRGARDRIQAKRIATIILEFKSLLEVYDILAMLGMWYQLTIPKSDPLDLLGYREPKPQLRGGQVRPWDQPCMDQNSLSEALSTPKRRPFWKQPPPQGPVLDETRIVSLRPPFWRPCGIRMGLSQAGRQTTSDRCHRS